MLGLVLLVAVLGIGALVGVFRESRQGKALAEVLSELRLSEILAGVLVSTAIFLAGVVMVLSWLYLSLDTAQILAGWTEPRHRSDAPTGPRIPEVTVPTFPEVPTRPTFTVPEAPTMPTWTAPRMPTPPTFRPPRVMPTWPTMPDSSPQMPPRRP